jgi:hypothetical protein
MRGFQSSRKAAIYSVAVIAQGANPRVVIHRSRALFSAATGSAQWVAPCGGEPWYAVRRALMEGGRKLMRRWRDSNPRSAWWGLDALALAGV